MNTIGKLARFRKIPITYARGSRRPSGTSVQCTADFLFLRMAWILSISSPPGCATRRCLRRPTKVSLRVWTSSRVMSPMKRRSLNVQSDSRRSCTLSGVQSESRSIPVGGTRSPGINLPAQGLGEIVGVRAEQCKTPMPLGGMRDENGGEGTERYLKKRFLSFQILRDAVSVSGVNPRYQVPLVLAVISAQLEGSCNIIV